MLIIKAEEERYSNRQIERLLDEQSKDIMRHIDDATAPILAQTMKTNGRVTASEQQIGSVKNRNSWFMGGLAVITVLIPMIVGIQVWMFLKILDIPHVVQQAVDEGFNQRVIVN